MRRGAALVVVLLLSACGSGSKHPSPTPTATRPAATATPQKLAIAPGDQAACAALYARLQRVATAISSASELLTQSQNPAQLAKQIRTAQQQLERSAQLMDSAVVPKPLESANRSLVQALHAFAGDFKRASAPAKKGDFQAAAAAMSDKPVTDRIVAAAKTIETACHA
jgi:hypothetical protein